MSEDRERAGSSSGRTLLVRLDDVDVACHGAGMQSSNDDASLH